MKDTTKLRLIKILAVALLCLLYIIIEAFALAPSRLTISYHTYYTDQISKDLDEFSIIFFSDLHLGTTYTSSNLQVIQDKINLLQGDIVLFGGDLLDHPSLTENESEIEALVTMLSGIDAKYGKYAVLGNHDLETLNTKNIVSDILQRSGFQIITNTSLRVHAGSDSSIRLIGLDSGVSGDPDVEKAYKEVRGSDLNILLCHTPDSISNVNSSLTDIMVSGHSHGHQVYIPLISQYFLPAQGQNYNRGEYYINDSYLLVSNGVGTTKIKARLFAESEINFLRLRYQEKEENITE